jgi:hypothetical protein
MSAWGNVAVYGLSLGGSPSAAHVAIVTDDPPGQRSPDVVNGEGTGPASPSSRSGPARYGPTPVTTTPLSPVT